ncbi:hypothetical protein CROQUDRAFT_17421, partial [Cronartium quercuum f. sp. fusiforme G11]
IDLVCFKTSDGPIFMHPFHAVEPFLTWMTAVEIFSTTKGVTHDADKIIITGSLICETNMFSFYASSFNTFSDIPWDSF